MKYVIRQRFNQNHDDKGLFAASAGETGPDNPPEPGKPFLVFRAGGPGGESLTNRNAGNTWGVIGHLASLDDSEGPKYNGQGSPKDLTMHVYEVTIDQPVENYTAFNEGKPSFGGDHDRVGYTSSVFGDNQSRDAFSFGSKGYTADKVTSFPIKDIYARLASLHPGDHEDSFDYHGWIRSRTALLDVVREKTGRRIKYNQNHSAENGQFSSGDGGVGAASINDYDGVEVVHDFQVVQDFRNAAGYKPSEDLPAKAQEFIDAHGKEFEHFLNEGLGGAGRVALMQYQGSGYHMMNDLLRKPETFAGTHAEEDWKPAIDDLRTGLARAPELPEGVQTWRAFRSKDVVAQAEAGGLVGKTFTDPGFLSTSLSPRVVGEDFLREKWGLAGSPIIALRVTTGEGARGIFIHGPFFNNSEKEILYDAGTPLHVTGATKTPHGLWVIDATVGKPVAQSRKYNPYHDDKGRFDSAPSHIASWDELTATMHQSVPDNKAMMGLMRHMSRAPDEHPNIINLSVGGDQIFHPDKSLGIARADMPQIPSAARDAYLSTLPGVQSKMLDPSTLNPVQNELDGYKTSLFALQKNSRDIMPVVSRDNYIIDGHHNWAGAAVRAKEDPNVRIYSHVVDMDHAALLQRTRDYAHTHGFEAKALHKSVKYSIRVKYNQNHDDKGLFATSETGDGMHTFTELFPPPNANYPWGDPVANDIPEYADALGNKGVDYFSAKSGMDKLVMLDYQNNAYRGLNAYLRGDTTTRIASDYLANKVGYGNTFPNNPETVAVVDTMVKSLSDSVEGAPNHPAMDVYRVFRSQELVAKGKDLVGETYVEPGFMSASLSKQVVGGFGDTRSGSPSLVAVRMVVPKDVPALYTPTGEHEVILDRGTGMQVTRVTTLKDGGIVIDAVAVAPKKGK